MKPFLDSNVLLYAISSDSRKAAVTGDLIAAGGNISVQVLNEFASIASRKHGLSWSQIGHALGLLRRTLDVWPLTISVHDSGLRIAERYRFSLYDSLLVAAALQAGCSTFFSEDLHDGQVIEGSLTIRNPFT
ncbi:MAG TPA: PIN domain-containing protein [Caulobacteraceae bacterium]|nr:PIN domain-containing protein [Caulobacteraceae bacterium]